MVKDMGNSLFLTPECTPNRPEIVDASTPWSDILLEELRTATQSDSRTPKRYGVAKFGSCRTHLRNQSRILWLTFLVIVGLFCAVKGGKQAVSDESKLVAQPELDGLQFVGANHPSIRYVGRWVSTADGTHKDGSFPGNNPLILSPNFANSLFHPGVYFDFAFKGSKTVLLSLHNKDQLNQLPKEKSIGFPQSLAFLPLTNVSSAAPISLLARVDDEEYIVIPNATTTTSIRRGNLEPNSRHDIRIIAPMVGSDSLETLQVEGIWIDEGAQLLPCETSTDFGDNFPPAQCPSPVQNKMLEIITDMPGLKAGKDKNKKSGITHEILGGVMGWEYLLGEMFGSDHVTIGMDGMCLIQDCFGGRGSPVMNIGNSDWESFQAHNKEYNKTIWELSAIRTLAYPKFSTPTVDSSRYVYSPQTGAGIPIFIVRPFRGQLEQATHTVVDRLRRDGDKNLFWLDTSGWLNTEIHFDGRPEDQDFFLDGCL
ncbi:uncharacterized protein K444DRAFT_659492 [Hyaloscypha bicolor E]|uniref:Uncharacterized protein n=1 Tax=Hyaloscypha bicolor E TaxID=1095630 RepID=A0A2J6TQA3_9HELO|nr:uncharacterized protein K444DRAFT_659492 [Hyaloscypha bicolor E]PMD65203.1 hypothetical protein K444DRAFT_659492 [Hyaloscypha bicolor E]